MHTLKIWGGVPGAWGSGKLTMCEQIIPSAGTKASSVCLGGDDGIGFAIERRCPGRKGPMHTRAWECACAICYTCRLDAATSPFFGNSPAVISPKCSQQSCNALFKLSCSIIIVEIYELHCCRSMVVLRVGVNKSWVGFCLSIAHRQLNLGSVDYAANPIFGVSKVRNVYSN